MTTKKVERGEYKADETKEKVIYFYKDTVLGIDIKSRERHKNNKKVVHFPFDRKGQSKYGRIIEIEYHGLPDPLPRGIIKDPKLGYGFTKILSPVLYALGAKFNLKRVIVKPKGKFEIKNENITMSYTDLNKFYPKMDTLFKTHARQKEALTFKFLSTYFPQKFKDTKRPYIKGSIYSLISNQLTETEKISKEDYDAMFDLVISKLDKPDVQSKKIVLATKEKIEKKFLEDAIKEFNDLLKLKGNTGNLEKKWEDFLKENSWIISNLFCLPVFLFSNQAYVGGKEIFNINGKVTDFLFKNALTDNLTIIELKTHKTQILSKKPYRGKDVYSISEELSGAINQALDQKQNLTNEFHTLRSKSGKENWFESYNSRCLIIAGHMKDLPEEGKRSFEIFRNNIHGVEIITFDEVLKKIEAFVSLVSSKKNKSKK
jgi:hypothetical protein